MVVALQSRTASRTASRALLQPVMRRAPLSLGRKAFHLLALLALPLVCVASDDGLDPPLRDVGWQDGKLSFLQMRSETSLESHADMEAGNGPVYGVAEKINWDTHDMKSGVTIVFNKESHSLDLVPGIDTSGIAWGHTVDNLEKTGWIELYIQTTEASSCTNDVRIYSAGYIEGALTAPRISQFYSNAHQILLKDEANANALQNVKLMFHDEIEYVKKNSNIHPGVLSVEPGDPYWRHARFVLFQVWGIRDAYNIRALGAGVHCLGLEDMWAINNHAMMPELMLEYTAEMIMQRRKFQSQPSAFLAESLVTKHAKRRGGGKQEEQRLRKNLRLVDRANQLYGAYNGDLEPPTEKTNVATEPHRWSEEKLRERALKAGDAFLPPVHRERKANATERAMGDRDWESALAKTGHCSAFVRVGPENGDLFVGHTTWDDYSKMTRIFKYYKFHFPGAWGFATHIGMSSYPGCVSSTDHFYMMNSGLAVFDTNLEILNPTVYNRVPEFPVNSHLPTWMHVMIVNRMARNAIQWTTLFGEQNNGQDNAQWMIVDYNKFSVGQPVPDMTLWILEQIPGLMMKTDVSYLLRNVGYWASYNRPYFPEMRAETGHTAAEGFYGAVYSYGAAPRAQIFARIGGNVETIFDMRTLMNRNEFPNEMVDPNAPGHAISARNDLDSMNHLPNGGIDAKVTSYCLFKSLQCQAISGPTHQSQAVFTWGSAGADLFPGWPHLGLPLVWNFDWVQMTPAMSLEKIIDVRKC